MYNLLQVHTYVCMVYNTFTFKIDMQVGMLHVYSIYMI